MVSRPKLLFVVTADWYFWSHRLGLALKAREAGYEVALASRFSQHRERIEAAGIKCWPLPFERSLRHPWRDLHSAIALAKLIHRERPALVHLVALKPILLSFLAISAMRQIQFVHAVTGLGYLFTSQDRKAKWIKAILVPVLRSLIGRSNSSVIVQNTNDRAALTDLHISPGRKIALIAGSGVDLNQFSPQEESEDLNPLVVLPARVLLDKGVVEFVAAAKLVRERIHDARFVIVGALDPDNSAAISEQVLQTMLGLGIEWWGHQAEMVSVMRRATVVCLPSHREGMPKALLEAAACARPLVATDVPGCRDICRDGVTGILVPPQAPSALAAAIEHLLRDSALRRRLGRAARALVEAEYSIDTIAKQTLALYSALLLIDPPSLSVEQRP